MKYRFFMICRILMICSVPFIHACASKYVTIATIGNLPPAKEKGMDNQKIVEEVIVFWKKELDQVLPYKPDLIVLPEACDRPQGMPLNEQFAYFRVRKSQIQDFFASVARENHCYIVFGIKHELEDGTWLNSSIILNREGYVAGIYNKNFPTIGELEAGIKPGHEAPVFTCDFGTIACALCFDLNFTELRDRYAAQKPDIILFPSMYYTCRSFFVGAIGNRNVPSEIRDPQGNILAASTNYFDFAVKTINMDTETAHLDFNWGKLRALKEKYGNKVTIKDPGKLGSVLITSEHESVSAKDMAEEFGIELLDDYLKRCRSACSEMRK